MIKSNFDKLRSTIDKMSSKSYGPDDRYWKLEQDKAGNGRAVIRFLPERGDGLPFVRLFNHGFKNKANGKWYIENCPTTLGEECPLCQKNSELWNSGGEAGKKIVSERKRRLSYIANILVVDDPKNPDNNGKVFLFKFGKKIYDMIVDKINPVYEDEAPVNVFCPINGADFDLRMRKVENFPNYDKSVFTAPAALFDGDEDKIQTVLDQMHDLEAEVAKDKFKPYADLKKRFDQTIGVAVPAVAPEEDYEPAEAPAPAPATSKLARPLPSVPKEDADEDEEDLAYFSRLAALPN